MNFKRFSKGFRHSPKPQKKLRACLGCRLLKTENEFKAKGCDNCDKDKDDKVFDVKNNTTNNFRGVIAITVPKGSWCAKWLGKSK